MWAAELQSRGRRRCAGAGPSTERQQQLAVAVSCELACDADWCLADDAGCCGILFWLCVCVVYVLPLVLFFFVQVFADHLEFYRVAIELLLLVFVALFPASCTTTSLPTCRSIMSPPHARPPIRGSVKDWRCRRKKLFAGVGRLCSSSCAPARKCPFSS